MWRRGEGGGGGAGQAGSWQCTAKQIERGVVGLQSWGCNRGVATVGLQSWDYILRRRIERGVERGMPA